MIVINFNKPEFEYDVHSMVKAYLPKEDVEMYYTCPLEEVEGKNVACTHREIEHEDEETRKNLKDFPVLDEPQTRIYIMLNSTGKIKIGKSKDIYKRYLSLSGSNSQGNEIIKVLVSPPTYLYTIETIMHEKFATYRIPNTEWFYDEDDSSGDELFTAATKELRLLFSSDQYKLCNSVREEFNKMRNRGNNDH